MVILDNPIISIDSMAKIIKIMKSEYVCLVQTKISEKFINYTAFFCNINMGIQKVPVMITSYDVINNKTFQYEKIIKFKINQNYKEIKINDNRTIYSNGYYGIAIIEIIPSKDKIKFILDLDDKIFDENYDYENTSIYIIQNNMGKEQLSVSYGYLKKYLKKFENFYNIFLYTCSTIDGSWGSPILNLANNKIIGMHIGGSSQRKKIKMNFGCCLALPINGFIFLKYKEKNFTNLQLISSGSYGDVYSAFSLKDEAEVCLIGGSCFVI